MEDLIIFKAGKDIFCDDYCIMYMVNFNLS